MTATPLHLPQQDVVKGSLYMAIAMAAFVSNDTLVKLLDMPSWRDTIRASALSGLGALGDPRALEIGLKYAAKGNNPQVRAAAISLLGTVGKDDPRVFPLVAAEIERAVGQGDFALMVSSADALANLGDPRGLPIFDRLTKGPGVQLRFAAFLGQFQERLRRNTTPGDKPDNKQP